MTSRLLSFFAIFMACFICFTVDWLGLLLFHLPFLLFLFSLFRCLLLCSNSVVLLSHLRWDFEAFILMMWNNWFKMRMIRSEISLEVVFVCTSIAMTVMVNILMWREMLVLLSRCVLVVLFVLLVFFLVRILNVLLFTPVFFGEGFVMSLRFPSMTTEVEAKVVIFDVISVVICSMSRWFVVIISNMIVLPLMPEAWLKFFLDSK